jgi:hypothetical protein
MPIRGYTSMWLNIKELPYRSAIVMADWAPCRVIKTSATAAVWRNVLVTSVSTLVTVSFLRLKLRNRNCMNTDCTVAESP